MLKGTEQYSFISVTPSNRTEENLGGNHKCLHISIICYIICIVPPSWHKLKVGFMQGLRRGEDPPPVAVVGGQAQQQQRGCDSLMGSSLLLREPRCRWLHPAKRAPGSATEHTWLDLGFASPLSLFRGAAPLAALLRGVSWVSKVSGVSRVSRIAGVSGISGVSSGPQRRSLCPRAHSRAPSPAQPKAALLSTTQVSPSLKYSKLWALAGCETR